MNLSSLIDQLGLLPSPNAPKEAFLQVVEDMDGAITGKAPVEESEDLARILALPRRRPPTYEEQAEYAIYMTNLLRRERKSTCQCQELRPNVREPCITKLFPIQGWYLYEAMLQGRIGRGVIGSITAGAGKTGCDILLPMVVEGTKRAVVLIPPGLRAQFRLDYEIWSQHFRVPNFAGEGFDFYAERPILHMLAYSELSHPSFAVWLQSQTDLNLIIADEAHQIRNRKATRTSRFMRFVQQNLNTKFCLHSGSLTTKSIDDYAHLSTIALREGSPLPMQPSAIMDWCGVLDADPPGGYAAPAGALNKFCAPGESPREGFCRRLIQTRGVVTTEDARVSTHLIVAARNPNVPENVQRLLSDTRASGVRPDGEELLEELDIHMTLEQLASGFYYRWKYPRGEPEALIDEWFAKRQAWNRELREKLIHRSDHMDSPGLCEEAGKRYLAGYQGPLPVWKTHNLEAWLEIENKVYHETEAVWVDDFLVNDAVAWAKEKPGILFYQHTAFGHRLSEHGKLPLFGRGKEAEVGIMRETGDRSIVASIKAHGEGRNLQFAFSRMLICHPPANGKAYEQVLARIHRYGQKAATAEVYVYQHAEENRDALAKGFRHAEYVHETSGKIERLLYAERVGV